MANDLTGNPLVFDTAAAAVAVTGLVHITKIRLVDYNNDIADGDAAILQNAAGKSVWEHRVTAPGMVADMESSFAPPLAVKGLIVPTLGHGKLYVYLAQGQTSIPVKTS